MRICQVSCQKRIFAGHFNFILRNTATEEYTEFFWRLTATLLRRIQHAEIGLAAKIMILILMMKTGPPKKIKNEELEELLHEDICHMVAELAKSLIAHHTIVSKGLKVLGMLQN